MTKSLKNYSLGGSAVELLVGEQATAFRESVIILGQVVVGAMAASWVNITTPIQIATNSEGEPVMLQANLDGAFPKILTMVFVILCWWMMAKKGMTPIKTLLIMAIVAFVGSVCGILG